jgi:hypothetical protein
MELATEERVSTLERKLLERIADLEREVHHLKARLEDVTRKDWRRTVGMFSGDEVMKQIDEAGRKIREADRERARKAAERAERRKAQRAANRKK